MKINNDLKGSKSNMAAGSCRPLKPNIKRQIDSHKIPKPVRFSPRSQYIFLIIKKFIQVNSSFS